MKKVILIAVTFLLPSTSPYALPILDGDKFFASTGLFDSSGWSYTGTLPSSVDAGFKAKNVDTGFFYDELQFSTGRRTMTTTTGNTPSYSLAFRGEFEAETFEAWEDSLLDQSLGNKFDSDVDEIEFPSLGKGIDNEHPIPNNWRSLSGYKNPTGSYAKFDKTFSLSRSYLNPGESGCPRNAGHCRYTESFFKGGANLRAELQAFGSIENIVPFSAQSVNINAKANRITTFVVNNDPLFSGDINGNASSFSLEEEKVNSVDFSFKVNFEDKGVSIEPGVSVRWDGSGNTASFDASYVRRAEMSDFVNVGSADEFIVEVRDDPQLSAGIEGTDFNKAKVLASTGLSTIDAVFKPVFEPVPSGRLSVTEAKEINKDRLLEIPDGGFMDGRFLRFNVGIMNDGFKDITVDDIAISIFDDDVIFDDLLVDFMRDNLNLLLAPGDFFDFAFNVLITADNLNKAIDSFEGDFLELKARGKFNFTDSFGTRASEFDVKFVSEPAAILLMLLGVPLVFSLTRKT